MTINQTASIGRSRITRQLYRFALAGAIIILAADTLTAQAASYAVIYDFQGSPDGGHPTAAVTYSKGGALYGTTDQGGEYGEGAAFELGPGAAGTWTETVLHSFGAGPDGSRPWANLVPSSEGALYGTTVAGGTSGIGTAFQLAPPPASGDPWDYSVIYNFGPHGSTNAYPLGAVLIVPGGEIFAVASSGAAVAIAPPAEPGGAWAGRVIDSYVGWYALSGLVAVGGGLFGTTNSGGNPICFYPGGCGEVYELIPPTVAGGAWTETTIHDFEGSPDGEFPYAALTVSPGGELYGTTPYGGSGSCPIVPYGGCGTVFELTPPASPGGVWTESVIHSFTPAEGDGAFPIAGVVVDQSGVVYGTTEFGGGATADSPCDSYEILGCGIVFALTPPAATGGAWTETILHNFTGQNGDGATPEGGLALGRGVIYGTTSTGGTAGQGTVFELVP